MNQKQKVKKIANSKVQPLILSCIVNIQGEYLLGQLLAINEFDRTAMVRHNNSAIWYNIDQISTERYSEFLNIVPAQQMKSKVDSIVNDLVSTGMSFEDALSLALNQQVDESQYIFHLIAFDEIPEQPFVWYHSNGKNQKICFEHIDSIERAAPFLKQFRNFNDDLGKLRAQDSHAESAMDFIVLRGVVSKAITSKKQHKSVYKQIKTYCKYIYDYFSKDYCNNDQIKTPSSIKQELLEKFHNISQSTGLNNELLTTIFQREIYFYCNHFLQSLNKLSCIRNTLASEHVDMNISPIKLKVKVLEDIQLFENSINQLMKDLLFITGDLFEYEQILTSELDFTFKNAMDTILLDYQSLHQRCSDFQEQIYQLEQAEVNKLLLKQIHIMQQPKENLFSIFMKRGVDCNVIIQLFPSQSNNELYQLYTTVKNDIYRFYHQIATQPVIFLMDDLRLIILQHAQMLEQTIQNLIFKLVKDFMDSFMLVNLKTSKELIIYQKLPSMYIVLKKQLESYMNTENVFRVIQNFFTCLLSIFTLFVEQLKWQTTSFQQSLFYQQLIISPTDNLLEFLNQIEVSHTISEQFEEKINYLTTYFIPKLEPQIINIEGQLLDVIKIIFSSSSYEQDLVQYLEQLQQSLIFQLSKKQQDFELEFLTYLQKEVGIIIETSNYKSTSIISTLEKRICFDESFLESSFKFTINEQRYQLLEQFYFICYEMNKLSKILIYWKSALITYFKKKTINQYKFHFYSQILKAFCHIVAFDLVEDIVQDTLNNPVFEDTSIIQMKQYQNYLLITSAVFAQLKTLSTWTDFKHILESKNDQSKKWLELSQQIKNKIVDLMRLIDARVLIQSKMEKLKIIENKQQNIHLTDNFNVESPTIQLNFLIYILDVLNQVNDTTLCINQKVYQNVPYLELFHQGFSHIQTLNQLQQCFTRFNYYIQMITSSNLEQVRINSVNEAQLLVSQTYTNLDEIMKINQLFSILPLMISKILLLQNTFAGNKQEYFNLLFEDYNTYLNQLLVCKQINYAELQSIYIKYYDYYRSINSVAFSKSLIGFKFQLNEDKQYQKQIYFNYLLCPRGQTFNHSNAKQLLNDPYFKLVYSYIKSIKFTNNNIQVEINEIINFKVEEQCILFNDLFDILQEQMWYLTAKTTEKVFAHLKELFNSFQRNKQEISTQIEQICSTCSQYQFSLSLLLLINYCKLKIEQMSAKEQRVKAIQAIYSFLKRVLPVCKKIKKNLCIFYISVINNNLKLYESDLKKVRNPQMLTFSFNDITNNIEICIASKRMPIGYQLNTQKNQLSPIEDMFYISSAQMIISQLIDYNYAICTTSLEKEQELYTLHRFLSRLLSRRLVYISITDESFDQALNDMSLFILNGFLVCINGINYLSHFHLLKLKLYLDNLQGNSFYSICEKNFNIKIDRYGNRGLVLMTLPTVVADISQSKTLFSSFSSTHIYDCFKMTIDFEKVSSVFANIQCIIVQKQSVEERFLASTRDYGKQFYALLTNMAMYKQFFLNIGVYDIDLIFSYVNKDKMFDVVVLLLHYILHSQILIMISPQKAKFIQTIIQLIVAAFGLDLIQVAKLQDQARVLSKIVDFLMQKIDDVEITYFSYFSKYIYEHFNNDYQIKLYFTNETHQIQYSFLFPIFQIFDIVSMDLPLLIVGNTKLIMSIKPYLLITKKMQMLSVYTEQELIQCIRFISVNDLPVLICVQPVIDSEIRKCLPHIIALQQFEPYIHDDKGYFSVNSRIKICMALNFEQIQNNQYVYNYFPRHYLLLSSIENTLSSKNILCRQFMNQFKFDIAQYEKIQTPQQDNDSCLQLLYIGRDPQERIDQRIKYQTILFCLPHLSRAVISHYSEILSQIFQFRYNPQLFLVLEQLLLFFSKRQGILEDVPYVLPEKSSSDKIQFIKLTKNTGDPLDHFETEQPEMSYFENMLFDDIVKYSQKMGKKNLTIQQMLEEIIDYQVERSANSQAIGSLNFNNYSYSINFIVKAILKPKTYLGSFSSFSLSLLVNLWNAYSILYMVIYQPSYKEMQLKYYKFLDIITMPNQNLSASTSTALIKACIYIAFEQGEKISKSVLNYCFENYRTIQQMRKEIQSEQINKYAQKLLQNITRLMPRKLEKRYQFIRFDQQQSLKVMFQPLLVGQNILSYLSQHTKNIDQKTVMININQEPFIVDTRRTTIAVVLSACLNAPVSLMFYGEFGSTGRQTLLRLAKIINNNHFEIIPMSFLSNVHNHIQNIFQKQIFQICLYPLCGVFQKTNHYYNYDFSTKRVLQFRQCNDKLYEQSALIYLQDHVYVFEEVFDSKIYSTLATTTDIPCIVFTEDSNYLRYLFDIQINFNLTEDIYDLVVQNQFKNDLAFDCKIVKWLIRNCRACINKSLISVITYNYQQQLQIEGSITVKLSLGQNEREFKIRSSSLIETYGNERNIMIRALQQTNLLSQSEQMELIQQAEILQQMEGEDEDRKLIQFNEWQNLILKRLYFEDFDMEVTSYTGSHNSILILDNIFSNFSERLWDVNPFVIFQAYSFSLIVMNNLINKSLFVTNLPYPSSQYYNQYIKSIKISLQLRNFNPEKDYKHVIIDLNGMLFNYYENGQINYLIQQLKNIILLAVGFSDLTDYANNQSYKPEMIIVILDFNNLCYFNFQTYQVFYDFLNFLNEPFINCPLFTGSEYRIIQERIYNEQVDFAQCIRKTLNFILVQSFSNDSAQNFYTKFNFHDLGPVFPTLQIVKEIPIKKYSKVFNSDSQQNVLTIQNIFELSNCLLPQQYQMLDVESLPQQPFQFNFIAVIITTYNTILKQANYIGCSFQRFWSIFYQMYTKIQEIIVKFLNNMELTMCVTNFYNRQCPLILSCMPLQDIDWQMIIREIMNSNGKRQVAIESYLLSCITHTSLCMASDLYWFFRYVFLQAAEIALSLVIYLEFLQTQIVTQDRMILLLNNYMEDENKEKQLSQLPHFLVTQIKEQLGYTYEHEKLSLIKSHINQFFKELTSFDIYTMLTQNPAIMYNIISESQNIIQIPQYNQAKLIASHILQGERNICTNSEMQEISISIITDFVKGSQLSSEFLLNVMNQLKITELVSKTPLPIIKINMQEALTYQELIKILHQSKTGKYIIVADNFNQRTQQHMLKSLLHFQEQNLNYYLVLISSFKSHEEYILYLSQIDFSIEMIFDHMSFVLPLQKPNPIDHAYNINYAFISHMYGVNFIPICLLSKFHYYWYELLQKYSLVQHAIQNLIITITGTNDMIAQQNVLKTTGLTENVSILHNTNVRQAFDQIEKTGNEYLDIYMSINTMKPGIFTQYRPIFQSQRVDFFKFQQKIDVLYHSVTEIFEIFIFLHKYADHLSQASSFPILMKIYSLNELFSILRIVLFPLLGTQQIPEDQQSKYILSKTLEHVDQINEFVKLVSLSTLNFIQYKIQGIFPTTIAIPLFMFISMYRVCQGESKKNFTLKAFMLLLQQSKIDFLQSMSALFLDDVIQGNCDFVQVEDLGFSVSDITELFKSDFVLIPRIHQFLITIQSCSRYDQDLSAGAAWLFRHPSHFLCLLSQPNIFCTLLSLLDRQTLFDFLKQSPSLLKKLKDLPEFKTSLQYNFQDFCLVNRKTTFINILQLAIFSIALQMENIYSIIQILFAIVNSISNLAALSIVSQKEENWLEKTRVFIIQTMLNSQIPVPQLQSDNIISQVVKIVYNIEYFLQYGQVLHVVYDPNLQPELYLQQTILQLKFGSIITFIEDMKLIGVKDQRCTYIIKAVNYHHKQQIVELFEQYHNKYKLVVLEQSRDASFADSTFSLNHYYTSLKDIKGFNMRFLKNLFLLFCYSKSIADQVFQSSCSICIQQLIQYSVNKIQDPDFIELFRTHFHDVNATQESATSVIKQYIQQEQVYIKNSKKNPANVQYTSRQIQEDVDSLKATKTTLEISDDDDDEDEFDDQMSDYGDEDDEQLEILDKSYILKEINEDIKSSGATFLGLIKTKYNQLLNMNDDSVIVSTMNLFFPPYRGIVKCPNKQVETISKFVVKYMRSQTNKAEIDFTDFLNQFQVEQLMLMSGFRFIFSNSATRQYFDQSQQQNNRILDQVIPDEIQNYLSYQDNQIPVTFSVFCPFLKLSDLLSDIPEYICAETVASDYFAIENANCWVVNGVQCYKILVNIFDLLLVKSSIDQMIPVHECQLFFTLKQPLQPVTVNADGSLNLGISGNHNPPFSLLIRGLQLVNGCYDEILQTVCDGNVESSIGFCQEMNIYVSVSKRNEIYSSLVPDNYVEAPIYLYNSTRFSILLPSICGISKEQWTKRKSYIGLYDIFQ